MDVRACPRADADEGDNGVDGKDDESLLQADLERVPWLERKEAGRADAVVSNLEHDAVGDDDDAALDAAWVGAGGSRDGRLMRMEGREEIACVVEREEKREIGDGDGCLQLLR